MRKIALMALSTFPLFAGFFPQTVHTSITHVENQSISLLTSFPINGMSGIIIHDYGNEVEAITSRVIQHTPTNVRVIHTDVVEHQKLPSIKTTVTQGDKVIGGYLYNNVLLLAPDAQTYTNITTTHAKNWVHPDLYALYLANYGDTAPTKANLKSFAKDYQVGLVYIVTNGMAKLLDPISGKIVSQKSIGGLPAQGQAPFFMRFDKIDAGLFSKDNTKSYYNIMDNL